ncbi:hypothetical protein [Kitasatospora purpeofusca]|uniref:VMAP-C domain-containing protein n=1 Tax=Kitasatospora purpeofusca TaxID=67352 RepID=UPI0036D3443D
MSGAGDVAPAPRPWAPEADRLLVNVLLGFRQMSEQPFRKRVVALVGQSAAAPGIGADIVENGQPRAHVWELVDAVVACADPWGALDALQEALRTLAPNDGALPWLELTGLAVGRGDDPPAGELIPLIAELRTLPMLPGLGRHVPENTGALRTPAPEETLPAILRRLLDRRSSDILGPLTAFLHALGADPDVIRCATLPELGADPDAALPVLRRFLDTFGVPAPVTAANGPPERLIVQIRLDEESPEHTGDSRYRLHVSYYRQPLAGGPFRRAGSHSDTRSFTKSELLTTGSARLYVWKELKQAIFRSAGPVRIEFLLPRSILGYAAELWSAGPTGRPLGQHHPVVVRQLERYTDLFPDLQVWRDRWEHIGVRGTDPAEVLGRIGWPSLDPAHVADLPRWLDADRNVACMGLDIPYDQLAPEVQYAVDNAMYFSGMPVLIWRRVAGDAGPLVEALREHRPTRLAELPDTVHRYRRKIQGQVADPEHTVTLLWDDPDCVDPDQDYLFPGMAG